eukprot:TRINITY_DN48356_c0_g1_i1.p1 TRINITY_DN48356_c0_g1~~TRINITY_DN48356_c0_g1_i1.p1  ORF type:complete len:128 (-),score=2.30 TRINITY_DN48356_c0_g1_i1:150-533(-)
MRSLRPCSQHAFFKVSIWVRTRGRQQMLEEIRRGLALLVYITVLVSIALNSCHELRLMSVELYVPHVRSFSVRRVANETELHGPTKASLVDPGADAQETLVEKSRVSSARRCRPTRIPFTERSMGLS